MSEQPTSEDKGTLILRPSESASIITVHQEVLTDGQSRPSEVHLKKKYCRFKSEDEDEIVFDIVYE